MKDMYILASMLLAMIIALGFVMLFQNVTNTDQQNYYLLKEVTQAAMTDSVDIATYRKTGEIRIYTEKFLENFIRRWSESALRDREYNIKVYDLIESPPKVSILVTTSENDFLISLGKENFDIKNSIDMIIETGEYIRQVE